MYCQGLSREQGTTPPGKNLCSLTLSFSSPHSSPEPGAGHGLQMLPPENLESSRNKPHRLGLHQEPCMGNRQLFPFSVPHSSHLENGYESIKSTKCSSSFMRPEQSSTSVGLSWSHGSWCSWGISGAIRVPNAGDEGVKLVQGGRGSCPPASCGRKPKRDPLQ